ncbi:MAG: hypothetical protein EA417_16220 [Gammaproteobacteria bacterium]|nr:MAG: hypothetical protein EA417_16220 [Gammaproteobacteria bacterium]
MRPTLTVRVGGMGMLREVEPTCREITGEGESRHPATGRIQDLVPGRDGRFQAFLDRSTRGDAEEDPIALV